MKYEGRKLYRIKALKNFYDVKKGDLGGWVSGENNLSQEGDCWIYNEAKCMDSSKIYDDGRMYDNSKMYGNSTMYENTIIYGNSAMYDHSIMRGYSIMYGNSRMFGHSTMRDYSKMYENSVMRGVSMMIGHSMMCGYSVLKRDEKLSGELASKVDKFIDVDNPSRQGRMVTGILKDGKILYNVGCQIEITKETFIERIYNEGGGIEEHPYRKEYLKIIDMIELYFSSDN